MTKSQLDLLNEALNEDITKKESDQFNVSVSMNYRPYHSIIELITLIGIVIGMYMRGTLRTSSFYLIDSMFVSLRFLLNILTKYVVNIDKRRWKKQISMTHDLYSYKENTCIRYLVYTSIISISFILPSKFTISLQIITIPSICNLISLNSKVKTFKGRIRGRLIDLSIKILTKHITIALNTITRTVLFYNPNVTVAELEPHIKEIIHDTEKRIVILDFIERFVTATIMHCINEAGYSFYIKIYNYLRKPNDELSKLSDELYARTLLSSREFGGLLDTEGLSVLLRLYIKNSKRGRLNLMRIIKERLAYITHIYSIIMSTWTFGVIFNSSIPVIIGSMIFTILMKRRPNDIADCIYYRMKKIIIVLSIMCYITNILISPFIISLLLEIVPSLMYIGSIREKLKL